jgi:iron(III) transport system substrate-binding protein
VYNRSLLASIIKANGAVEAEEWARGLVNNLARRPQGNDRAQIKAIHSGECDLGLVNNYYYGKLLNSKVADQRLWAKSVRLVFMNQSDRGNHVNISGGGLVKYSKNKENGIKLLEFLTGEVAQKLYGEINFEYPVNPAVGLSKDLKAWGDFKEDTVSIEKIAELARKAQKIIDRSGW